MKLVDYYWTTFYRGKTQEVLRMDIFINSNNFRFLLFYDLLLYGIGLISKRKESQTEQRLEGLKCHENPKSIDDKDH